MKSAIKRKYIFAFGSHHIYCQSSGKPVKETFVQIIEARSHDGAMNQATEIYKEYFKDNEMEVPDGEFKVIDYKEGKLLSVGCLYL